MAKRSSTAIATEREEIREEQLKADGWITTRVTNKSQWSKGKDFFGIADILCFKPDRIRLVDVSSYNSYGKVEIMKKWLKENYDNIPQILECEVAVWKPASKTKPERWTIHVIEQEEPQ